MRHKNLLNLLDFEIIPGTMNMKLMNEKGGGKITKKL